MELMHFLDISNFNSICVCSLFTVTISLFFLSIILLFTGCAGGQSADVDDVKIALIILGCESAEVTGIAPEAYLVPLVIVTKQDGETKSVSADTLAPGENILLASRNGVPYGVRGTSFSTGYVSAYAAKLLAEEPTLTPEELIGKIIEEAEAFGGLPPQ